MCNTNRKEKKELVEHLLANNAECKIQTISQVSSLITLYMTHNELSQNRKYVFKENYGVLLMNISCRTTLNGEGNIAYLG